MSIACQNSCQVFCTLKTNLFMMVVTATITPVTFSRLIAVQYKDPKCRPNFKVLDSENLTSPCLAWCLTTKNTEKNLAVNLD